ncbi:MAG: hypothetical protein K0R67_1550 [Paenibacillus sp.]|jgi:energy-coupling factor transport system ATP-binding protein|nr:hypothetical protein [Paenibacillus sp.]
MDLQAYRLERISIAFSSHNQLVKALDNISLEIVRGEWLTLAGRNGSGKSTLAKVLAGIVPLSAGSIRLGWMAHATTRMVMQNPESQLIGQTVEEDLLFTLELSAAPIEDWESVLNHALEMVGLREQRSQAVTQLSGGQKQLLAIAGCVIAGADCIVFDEAASMLDPLARGNLLQAAKRLHDQGVTIVWVTHAMEELVWTDHLVALDKGCITYDGDVRSFLYGTDKRDENEQSICEQLGFSLPFAVEAARELMGQGIVLAELPLTCEELFKQLEVKL